jgi:hypothetical protein
MEKEYQKPEVEVVSLVTEEITDLATGKMDVVSSVFD